MVLETFVSWILYDLISLDPSLRWVESLNFFVYDSIKIILMLLLMISVVGFIRSYLPPEKIKNFLSGKKKGAGNVLASLIGAATPFCSCSSIPIFFGFIRSGVPLGIAFSFLITSPIINEYVVVIMWGIFGWKITAAYVASGLLIGVVSGMILGEMDLEKYLERDIAITNDVDKIRFRDISDRVIYGIKESLTITKKLWLWILIGVALGALAHNYVPDEAIHSVLEKTGAATVPLATIIGVPIYASCVAIVPVAFVLFSKGIPIGTALAFMMAASALSFAEAVILRKAMKLKLIAIFFSIVALGIMIIGYLMNFIQKII